MKAHTIRGHRRQARSFSAILAVLALATLAPATQAAAGTTGSAASAAAPQVTAIVRTAPAARPAAERAARQLGARILHRYPTLDAFSARLPLSAVASLRAAHGVLGVSPDGSIHLSGGTPAGPDPILGYAPTTDWGSMYNITKNVGAQSMWSSYAATGTNIGVALIDSGVAPLPELAGRVVNGPDLSFDSQDPLKSYTDGYGHGTAMAGIIAGRDPRATTTRLLANSTYFVGMAPDARIINMKVADGHGTADVSQVLAAIDWVITHRNDPGLNIRIISLSFGTDSTQDPLLDPLAYAAESAWRNGLVVVAAAGNGGATAPRLNDPAIDPYIIAVGASDFYNSASSSDDTVPAFSSRGSITRRPDFVAPGRRVISLRVPGSYIDLQSPNARIGTKFSRGSGTSQATAVTAGAVALMLQKKPLLTPDQVKRMLVLKVATMRTLDPGKGAGRLMVYNAYRLSTPVYTQTWPRATGTGTLEGARGSIHVYRNGVKLQTENDVLGSLFVASEWAAQSLAGTAWQYGGYWNYALWSGNCFCTSTASGMAWDTVHWIGTGWDSVSWDTLGELSTDGRIWTGDWTGEW